MRRKFLSVVLCVCMMLTMAPFAFAEGVSSGGGGGGSSSSVSATDTWSENKTGDLTITEDNAVIDGNAMTYTNGTITVTAANVTIQNLTFGDKAALVVNTTGKFTLTGCTFTPTTPYTKGSNNQTLTSVRTAVNLNVGEAVVTNNIFSGTTDGYYNAIEFGIDSSANDLGKATITGNTFNSAIKNNYFNFYNMTANASIEIQNNKFLLANKGSNAIRISNPKNVTGVIFNIDENEYTYVSDSTDSQYEGLILLQDYSGQEDTQNFSGINLNIKNLSAPESAKQLLYVYDDQDGIISYNQPAVTGDSSIEKFAVAKVGDFYSPSLASAVAAATDGQTITLLKDTALTSSISIKKNITLDLGGKTLSRDGGMLLDIYGNVTIQNGTVAMTNTTGSGADIWVNKTATLTVEKSATISAPSNSFAIAYYEDCTAAKVTLRGTLTGDGSGITVNGNIKDKDSSNQNTSNKLILDGTTINVKGHGVYQAGYATTTFTENASTITGSTGIEVRAGNLTVTNSTITGNGTFNCKSNPSGTTTDGVGIAIAQHTTKLPIDVTISGGNISGTYAVYESDPENNGTEYTKDVKLSITGGYFTTDPSAYCVENKTGVATGKADYPYTVGDKKADSQPATVDSATVPANTTSTDPIVKEAAEKISGATLGNSNSIEAATKNEANNNKITADTTVGSSSTVLDSLKTIPSNSNIQPTDVAIVYQTYVDVTVTDAKKDSSNLTELTVNLTPMYRVVATTKNVTDIKVKCDSGVVDNEANAILIENAKKLNVPAQAYEVTLALPSGFAIGGAKLSIKHTKGSSVEYYTGTVSEASSSSEDPKPIFVTFTTNGFSPFVIYAASQSAASVNGVIYPSFQEAVNAAQNNDEITLLKGDAVSATMTGSSKTIKVKRADTVSGNVNVTVNGENKTLGNGTTEVTFTYTRPSSGGSISTPTTYAVNVNAATNGAVAADKKTASKGTTVTVTASPSKGYVVDAVKVVDKDGKDVAVTEKDGKYVFTMPASAVTVTGSFKAETPAPVALPFTDVKSGNWFYDAVKYAYAQGLMTGTSATTFAPNGTMNRAMIVTVLYRLEKSPAVTGASKFTDVPAGQWYSDAVAWAAANKIVNGYDETTFGPMNAVTREQMAAILFRYEQVKGLENVTLEENLNRFPDQNKISAYAIPALQWAVGQKIINGNADGTLDPTGTATRAQVAQIFTNLLNK